MPLLIVSVTVLILVAAASGFLYWSFRKAFYHPNAKKKTDPHRFLGREKDSFCKEPMLKLVDELENRTYESVRITSRDGLSLFGRLYLEPKSNVVEIIFHGWRGSALRDGCGGSHLARKAGHSILLVDQRAHGESDGNVITFGIKEKYDCLDWTNYITSRFGADVKILLVGLSMGAATVLMASSLDLPETVKGIAADCGYSSPEAIIRKVCRCDMGIPDRIGYPFVRLAARLFGGFSMNDGGAVEAVRRARVPILLIHGTEDDFVPVEMCREIYDACTSEKFLLEVPRAGHGLSLFYDWDAYVNAVRAYQEKVL